MFGYLIPRNYKEAMQFDSENKNSKWYDAIKLEINRNMSKSKGWALQSSLLMLWMEKTRVNNQTKIDDDVNLLITL